MIALAVSVGCEKPAVEQSNVSTIQTRGSASVKGKVTFAGTPTTPKPIDNSICHHAGAIVDESVLVSADGGLKNAIVYITGVRGPMAEMPETVELDQKDCRFVPHVIGVRVGQPMRIKNSESEAHNVHATPSRNPAFNIALATAGSSKEVTFASPEFIRVKCDVHPWMTGYIGVFDSPYFAVTGEDGSFEIDGLPEGTYELVAWHERFGELKQSIQVQSGPAEVSFVYRPPGQ